MQQSKYSPYSSSNDHKKSLFNNSISFIMEDKAALKKLSIEDIAIKGKYSQIQDQNGLNMPNFKEFYENSKEDKLSTKSSMAMMHRSKSTYSTAGKESFSLQSKLSKPIIKYNINEYLPGKKSNDSFINSSQLSLIKQANFAVNSQLQQQTRNVFQDNFYQQSQFSHQSPNSNVSCTCGAQSKHLQSMPNMLQTQRSSCSCQYSSSCHSQYASPISNYSKNNQQHKPRHSHANSKQLFHQQSSQPNFNLQQMSKMPIIQQQAYQQKIQNPQLNMLSSSENTPFKPADPIMSSNMNAFSQLTNRSPQSNFANQLFINQSKIGQEQPDRSMSFIRNSTSDKKQKTGYNTDDLLRDSESEVDLNQVSSILQEVQNNFQEGFQNYLKLSMENQNQDQDRAMKEQLAMQILHMNLQKEQQNRDNQKQNNSKLNDSQIQTLKPTANQAGKPPQLTLDFLQISNIQNSQQVQTPFSNFDTNSSHNNIIDFNYVQSQSKPAEESRSIPQPNILHFNNQQLSQPNHLQILATQYQSPCFNSFEDSSLNLFQVHNQSQASVNYNMHSDQTLKHNYNSVPQQQQQLNQQQKASQALQVQQAATKKQKRPKRKKSINKKLLKKSYNQEQEYSNPSESDTQNGYSQDSQTLNSQESQAKEGEQSRTSIKKDTATFFQKKDQGSKSSQKNVKDINIQTSSSSNSSSNDILEQQENKDSQLLQNARKGLNNQIDIQTEKTKSDASCQYEMLQPPTTLGINSIKKPSLHPPQTKRGTSTNKNPQPNHQTVKSVGCSGPSSKNSTINHLNSSQHHFQSQNPSQDLEDYYLQIDVESLQHQSLAGGNSCGNTTSHASKNTFQMNNLNQGGHHNFSNPSILSPYNPAQSNYRNFDHFKSQCSEVIIRGSSETDISNKIAMVKKQKIVEGGDINAAQHFQSQSNLYQNTSHQISGSQSIVNIEPHSRSQFTSIETQNNYSPSRFNSNFRNPNLNHRHEVASKNDYNTDSLYDVNNVRFTHGDIGEDNMLAGDTFMKSQRTQQYMMNTEEGQEEEEMKDQRYYEKQFNKRTSLDLKELKEEEQQQQYTSIGSENINKEAQDYQNTQGSQQQQTDEEFNYTIRLQEQSSDQKPLQNYGNYAQRPPIYQNNNLQNQHTPSLPSQLVYQQLQSNNSYFNGTGSTAGFPQIQGYQFSQQTGRKSSVNSSFHSQSNNFHYIKNSNSQASLVEVSQRSLVNQSRLKKLSFMEKIIMIQRKVREFLQRRREEQMIMIQHYQNQSEMSQNLNFYGDSTIQKPVEDSLSNISAQLLNSLKQSLGSNVKKIKPGDQSYQKNILESLNLTTGNTFVKDTKQFNQGMLKDRTQFLGNSSAGLVLYSGSTNDNRHNPFQGNSHVRNSDQFMIGNLPESQNSYGKPPLYEYEAKDSAQSPNNTSLLNLTEESNSGIFKLTPMGSQNITQKTYNIQHYNQTSNMNERTTESNNLNYSCSELDSEWFNNNNNNNFQRDYNPAIISPLSVNTTSSKFKNLNGGAKIGQRIGINSNGHILFQRSGSVQSEQIQPLNENGQRLPKHTQKIKIEEYSQSPLSHNQIHSTKSAANIVSKQEKMLSILQNSQELEEQENRSVMKQQQQELTITESSVKEKSQDQLEWKLLKPLRQSDLNNILIALLTNQQQMI